MSEWSDWYVYRIDGPPIGPLSTSAVAEAILAGRLPPDCWVCAPGGPRWLRAVDVPAIASILEAVPTRRRGSRMRIVTAPMRATTPPNAHGRDASAPKMEHTLVSRTSEPVGRGGRHDETIRTTSEPEPSPEPPTMRSGPPRGPDGFPIAAPPPSSSPTPPSGYRGGETLESPFDEPPRKKTLGA